MSRLTFPAPPNPAGWLRQFRQRNGTDHPSHRLISQAIQENWRPLSLSVGTSFLAAVFEGLTFAFIALAIQVLSEGRLPAFGHHVDAWLGALSAGQLFAALVGMVVAAQIVRGGLLVLNNVISTRLATVIQHQVQETVFRRVMDFSYPCASRYRVGDLANYVVSPSLYISELVLIAGGFVTALFTTLAYLAVLVTLSWPLLASALILFGSIHLLQRRLAGSVQRLSSQLAEAQTEMSRRIVESIHGLRALHTFDARDQAARNIGRAQDRIGEWTQALTRRLALIGPLSDSLVVIAMGAFLLAGYFVFSHTSTSFLPQLITFIAVLNRLAGRVSGVGIGLGELHKRLGLVEVIDEVLRPDGKTFVRRGGQPFHGLLDGIEFRDVSLTYSERPAPAVEGVSLFIPKGKVTALVGPSGAGKSSLVDLLVGLYEPTAGTIRVDGTDYRELNLSDWLLRVGVVSQDTVLFNDTIRENIRFGRPDATAEEIRKAARLAHAEEFIARLPAGYDTVIGERGFTLSGGQRQRLALARALLRGTDLLILDEATSALDSQSEQLIQQALHEREADRTLLVVAHRLSTVADADQIWVLDQGRIVESGTHAELLERRGHYARQWEAQTGVPV